MGQCTATYYMTIPIYLISPFTPIYLMSHMERLRMCLQKNAKT